MAYIFFLFLGVWVCGTYLIFTHKNKDGVHSAFLTMWGHRYVAISILVICMVDAMVNKEWDGWGITYSVAMASLFLRHAVLEYYANGKFKRLYNEKYKNN